LKKEFPLEDKVSLHNMRTTRWVSVVLLTLLAMVLLTVLTWMVLQDGVTTVSHTTGQIIPIQDNLEVVPPDMLQRISWGAVIAGTFVAIAIDIMLSLLGVAAGVKAINPLPEPGEEPTDFAKWSMGSGLWMMASVIIALAAGGWVAARTAGLPTEADGVIHGVLVWAVATVFSMFVLTTFGGKVIGSVAGLVKYVLDMLGTAAGMTAQVAGNTAQVAGHVAGDAVHTVGNVAGSTAQAAGGLMYQALGTLAQGMNQAAQVTAEGVSHTAQNVVDSMPMVKDALENFDLSFESIKSEAYQLMREAGKSPEDLQHQAQDTVEDMENLARVAVRHPEHLDRILELALRRVFRRAEGYIGDVDRDNLVQVLMQRTNMTEDEAVQQIERWEARAQEARHQVEQMRQTAMEKAQELRQQAEDKANEIVERAKQQAQEMYDNVQSRMDTVRNEVVHQAREAADTTTNIIASLAAAIVFALFIGGIAAGIGGAAGSPDDLTVDAVIEDVSYTEPDM
jgi:ElaB/YqjD/DUF883 family membrane-anchored ribosome-binding protein